MNFNYKLAKEIYGNPWFMDAFSLQVLAPTLEYLRSGGKIEEKTEKNNDSFLYDLNNRAVIINREYKIDPESENEYISIIKIDGPITKNGGGSSYGMADLAKRLNRFDKNQKIVGHIIHGESGGGSSRAVPIMREAIQNAKKPVVMFGEDIVGSAMYYIGMAADYMIMNKGTDIVGSIGTMLEFGAYPKIAEDKKDGFRHIRIYASKSTKKNAEFEAAVNDLNFKPVLDKILNPANERFIEDVRADRPNVQEKELTGETFEANQVIGTLIDEVGNFETAINKVLELANVSSINSSSNINLNQGFMNLDELKQKHPNLVNEIKNETLAEERDRVDAYLEFADVDLKACTEGIQSGKAPSAKFFAVMAKKGMMADNLQAIKNDSIQQVETKKGEPKAKKEDVEQKELEAVEAEILAAAGVPVKEEV